MAKLSLQRDETQTLNLFPEHAKAEPDTPDRPNGPGAPGIKDEAHPVHAADSNSWQQSTQRGGDAYYSDGHPELPPLPPADFINKLNPVQYEAVSTLEGPLLIVAGAGSGKTRVLTYRIAYMLAQGVAPWNVLALTFTNKAAREMRERIGELVGDNRARPLWMGTFHSVFSRILRREGEKLGYTSSFSIYDTDDSLGVVRAAMAQYGISPQDFSPKMIHSQISSAKNSMIPPTLLRSRASSMLEERVALVYEMYEKKLRANNAMDFDDLLVKTIELFEKHKDVLERYQKQFQYILIDEYQDTNRAQYTVVKMLAEMNRNIGVVGDDAQSIYRFRGADIRNILDFERDYPDYKIFRLEQNYRSTKTILAAADDVIKNNRSQIPKTLWTDNPEGEKIKVTTLRDERDEGDEVLRIVQQEQRAGKSLNDIAVLYRINSQSLSIEDTFRRNNIPYTLVGSVGFYQRKEVKDALAYLRLVVNERDDESFARAINTPSRGIGEVSIKRLRHFAEQQGTPLLKAAAVSEHIVDVTPRATNALHRFVEIIDSSRTTMHSGTALAETARMLLTDAGVLQAYKDEGTPEAMARWDNVQRILSHIAEYTELNPEATLDQYLQEISLVSEADNYDASAHRVTLMTIHSAKGLEFPAVIVTGMEEGLFPVGNTAQQQEDLEEERRLFYVAVTRAKEMLYLCNCERRYRFGELSYPTPSRFLTEIREDLLEFNVTAPPRPVFGNVQRERRGHDPYSQIPSTPARRPGLRAPKPIDPVPDDDYSQVPQALQVGVLVYHESFGTGQVETITGSGDKAKIAVRFDKVGKKQLMLKFANLRLVS